MPSSPTHSLSLDLHFRPTRKMRLQHRLVLSLGRLLPIPREQEIQALASTVLGDLPDLFCRTLFLNALSEACWLWQGAWNVLDLPHRQSLDPTWTTPGASTLFLSMHHGNWEWLAGILFHLRSDTIGVARSAHHPLGQRLLRWVRDFHKTPVYYDRDAILRASHQLQRNGLVAFLPDQRPPTGGIPGLWLGQPTLVTPLPLVWTRSSTPSLWIGQLIPSSTQTYHLDLHAYPPADLPSWDRLLDLHFLPWIKSHPALHFGFFHRRLVSRETCSPV